MKENNTKFSRRNFLKYLGWTTTLGTMAGAAVGSTRFMFPNILYEPSKSYKVGRPQDYLEGVTFLPDKKIFLVYYAGRFKALSAVCTHLGCTPNWVEEKRRFLCPCHGSVFNEKGSDFFKCSDPARQGNEPVGEIEHHGLAVVHRFDHV